MLNVESSAALGHRFRILRNLIKRRRNRQKAFKKIFHLNVFQGEFDDSSPISFDQPHDPNPVHRELKLDLENLQQSTSLKLADKENRISDLHVKVEELSAQNANLSAQNTDLSARNTFLTRHVEALEDETNDQNEQLGDLKQKLNSSKNVQPTAPKVLGQVKFTDLGPDGRNKTRAAYKRKAQELNVFGANRALTVNQIILRDQNGKKVPINVKKPNTYPNLTEAERQEVATASAWKDQKRVSDKSYSSLTKIGKIPAAAHVKQYEQELNTKLSPILPVIQSIMVLRVVELQIQQFCKPKS